MTAEDLSDALLGQATSQTDRFRTTPVDNSKVEYREFSIARGSVSATLRKGQKCKPIIAQHASDFVEHVPCKVRDSEQFRPRCR